MKTTEQWIHEIKTVPGKLEHWLKRQYIGEMLAANRIAELATTQVGTRSEHILNRIASDEKRHSEWIKGLLDARKIPLPTVSIDGTRYWEPILGNLHSFEEVAGAGHHAETMRLVRIEMLSNDEDIDSDIRNIFSAILVDEQFHAKAFNALSTPAAIENTRLLHADGLKLLGLVI
jgi:hypothetical protein